MPVSKTKRRNGTKATHRAPIWLSSREYRALLAKMYLMEQRLEAVRGFLAGMIESMNKAARDEANPAPIDTGTPGIDADGLIAARDILDKNAVPIEDAQVLKDGVIYSVQQDPTTWSEPERPSA